MSPTVKGRLTQAHFSLILWESRASPHVLSFSVPPPSADSIFWSCGWVSQGTSHLTYLLGHLNAEDNVGTLLRIMLDTLQLHLGFPLSPLTYPYTSISRYIDPSWLSSTWYFMTEASALLTLSDQWTLPLDRQNDCHLMPQLVSLAATFPSLPLTWSNSIAVDYIFRFSPFLI